jgi:Tfp pilus assembly protein PilF
MSVASPASGAPTESATEGAWPLLGLLSIALAAALPLLAAPVGGWSESELILLGLGEPGFSGAVARFQGALAGPGWAWPLTAAALLAGTGLCLARVARALGLLPSLACMVAALSIATPLGVESSAWRGGLGPLIHGFAVSAGFAAWCTARANGRVAWAWGTVACFALASTVELSPVWLALMLVDRGAAFHGAARKGAVDRDPVERSPATHAGAAIERSASLRAPALAMVGLAVLRTLLHVTGSDGASNGLDLTGFAVDGGRESLLTLELWARGLWASAAPFEGRLLRPVDPYLGWFDATGALALLTVALGGAVCFLLIRARRLGLAAALAWWWLAGLDVEGFGDPLGGSYGAHPLRDAELSLGVFGSAAFLAWLLQRAARPVAPGALVAALVAAGVLAHERRSVWFEPESLTSTAIAESPDAVRAWWVRGDLLLERHSRSSKLEDLSAASACFASALELCIAAHAGEERDFVGKDDVLETNLGQGWCELRLSEIDGFDDPSAALSIFEQLSDNYTRSTEARIGLGLARMAMGDDAAAVEALREAITLSPDSPDAHANLGRLHYRAGRFDDARRHLDHAVGLSAPDDADVRLWAARANLESGQVPHARELANEAAALARSAAAPHVVLGGAALAEQDPAAALGHFEDALERDEREALAHDGRGLALILLQRPQEALLAWRRACDFGPELFNPHYRVASILLTRGLDAEALPYLRRAYELSPDAGSRSALRGQLASNLPAESLANLELASLDNQRGDVEAARSWAARYTAAKPDDSAGWILGGQLATRAGDAESALVQLERARELGVDTFGLYLDFARAHAAAGNSVAAADALTTARERMPDLTANPELRQVIERQLEQLEAQLSQGPLPAPGNE